MRAWVYHDDLSLSHMIPVVAYREQDMSKVSSDFKMTGTRMTTTVATQFYEIQVVLAGLSARQRLWQTVTVSPLGCTQIPRPQRDSLFRRLILWRATRCLVPGPHMFQACT